MNKDLQPVKIDTIEFDALIDQTESYSASAPSYPTESGFSIQDSIVLEPLELTMTLFVTNTPVTWLGRHGTSSARVDKIVSQLIDLYKSRKLVTITTTSKIYKNMAITSLEVSKTLELGYAREIPITFNEITTTETKTTDIPDEYQYAGASMAAAGDASTTGAGGGSGGGGGGAGGAGTDPEVAAAQADVAATGGLVSTVSGLLSSKRTGSILYNVDKMKGGGISSGVAGVLGKMGLTG